MSHRTEKLVAAIIDVLKEHKQLREFEPWILKRVDQIVTKLNEKKSAKIRRQRQYGLNCAINNIFTDLLEIVCMIQKNASFNIIDGEIRQCKRRTLASILLAEHPYKSKDVRLNRSIQSGFRMLISEAENVDLNMIAHCALLRSRIVEKNESKTDASEKCRIHAVGALYQAQMARHSITVSLNESLNSARDTYLNLASDLAILPVINASLNTMRWAFRYVEGTVASI